MANEHLPANKKQALDEELLLGDRDYDALATRYGVSKIFILRASRDLGIRAGNSDEALARYSTLGKQIIAAFGRSEQPDETALIAESGFTMQFVKRTIAHAKAELSSPEQSNDGLTESADTIEVETVEDVFPDTGPELYDGRMFTVVFAPNPTGSRYPVRDYLREMYTTGSHHRLRAKELRTIITTYADTGRATSDSIHALSGGSNRTLLAGLREFRVFKHRLYFVVATVASHAVDHAYCVLLSAHEKKADLPQSREHERANRNYEAWVNSVTTKTRRVKNPPDDMNWNEIDSAGEVQLNLIKLMQDLQAVVRDAMHRDGVSYRDLGDLIDTTEDGVERILWDTSVPLSEVVKAATALGVQLGGRETES